MHELMFQAGVRGMSEASSFLVRYIISDVHDVETFLM